MSNAPSLLQPTYDAGAMHRFSLPVYEPHLLFTQFTQGKLSRILPDDGELWYHDFLPTAAPSVPIRVNRNNQHAHADSRAVGNSHRNEASNAPTNGTFPATEPPRLLVEQVARLSTNSIPTRRSRLAKEPAPTFAMDTQKNAVTCPFSLVEQQPSLSLFFS